MLVDSCISYCSCQFCFVCNDALLLGTYTLRSAMSSWRISPYCNICLSLSLITFLALQSSLSEISIAAPLSPDQCDHGVSFSNPFLLICRCLYISSGFLVDNIIGSCFFDPPLTICPLLHIFRLLAFKMIIDILAQYLPYCFLYVTPVLFSCFSLSLFPFWGVK